VKLEVITLAIDYGQLQRWLIRSGFTPGKHTPSWAIAQALILYNRGLSLRRVAEELEARRVPRSHVAIWKWI
jgi:transposase-like protein